MIRLDLVSRPMRSRYVPVLLLVLVACIVRGSWADLAGPSARDSNITKSVTLLLRNDHLSRHPLDDEISQRFLKSFIKTLDPMKVYFYQSDIDGFFAQQNNLDDQIKKGDTSFAYTVFTTLLERIDERVKFVDELLAMEHDFTVDEEMVTDPDTARYATSQAEARDQWRKRIKYDLLVLKEAEKAALSKEAANPDAPVKKAEDPLAKLKRRYHSFATRMRQTDNDELLEMYLTSFTTAYDPHTTYMSASSLENFDIVMKLSLDGIGAALQFDDGFTVVSKVIPGGAADKDGRLKAQDKITGVGQGTDGEIVPVVDMKLNDVVGMIRGKRGTVVRLEVEPVGTVDRKIYDITRAEIALTDSEARGEVIEQTHEGQTYRVGVIDLPSFYMDMKAAREGRGDYKSTTRDVARLLADFREKHVDAVIMDLRRNGGGSLTEAISLTGLFIDQGPVVQVKDKNDKVQQYDDLDEGADWDGPLVVLTSKFSASASEIFAGAIQDYGRGLIVGDKSTHGKGTVQSLLDLGERLFRLPNAPKLGALKITMQQFYRPNGDSTQNRGVLADVELPSLTNELEGISESDLDFALAFDRVPALDIPKVGMVDKSVLDRLNSLSSERRKDSEGFQKVLRNIDRYREQKSRKSVTLNEAKFLAERAELNADKEEEKEMEELNNPNRPIFDAKFFYNQEAVAIALDYLQLTRLARAN